MLIGIDFGATSIKGACVTRDGAVTARASVKTVASRGPEGLLDDVAALIGRLGKGRRIDGVGIGLCGMVDTVRQEVRYTTDTLPGWRDVPISKEIFRRTGVVTVCDNDGNAAAWGEYLAGAGKGVSSLVVFTLGTGVGGGIVLDGKRLVGASYTAGHLGHIKVRAGGRKCPCGDRGCLEAYASAFAMRRLYHMEPAQLFNRAKAGDAKALGAVDEAADALGRAFATVACTINPEIIAMTGGIAKGWPALRRRALESFAAHALPDTVEHTRVVRSALGNDAGVIGAAMLCIG